MNDSNRAFESCDKNVQLDMSNPSTNLNRQSTCYDFSEHVQIFHDKKRVAQSSTDDIDTSVKKCYYNFKPKKLYLINLNN